VHVISRKKLKEAAAKHPSVGTALDTWFRVAKKARWKKLDEVRKTYPTADSVNPYTVFNVKGNRFRLVTEINYERGRIYIRHVLTHAEHDKGKWKL
jgi:mRNA interferase HigB